MSNFGIIRINQAALPAMSHVPLTDSARISDTRLLSGLHCIRGHEKLIKEEQVHVTVQTPGIIIR